MAKIVITVEDKDDGTVSGTAEFLPPIESQENATPAQWAGVHALHALREYAAKHKGFDENYEYDDQPDDEEED